MTPEKRGGGQITQFVQRSYCE